MPHEPKNITTDTNNNSKCRNSKTAKAHNSLISSICLNSVSFAMEETYFMFDFAAGLVKIRIGNGWNKFRQLVPLLTNKDVSLTMRGRLYSSCVRSSMLHGSETWPVRKENVVALQRAEMTMVRWMCGIKLKDRLPSKELRERLGVDDIALVLQQNRLRWYGHVLRKDDDDWVKKCTEYEVEGPRPRGRPKRTWREVVQEDCQARKLNKEDAMDHCKWRKLIKDD